MKRSIPIKSYLPRILFFCVLLVLILSARYLQNTRQSFSSLIRIAASCQKPEDKTVDVLCVRNRIRPFVTDQNIPVLLRWMDYIFSNKSLAQTSKTPICTTTNPVVRHALLHSLGEIAYEKQIPIDRIYLLCQNACDFGCFHGAFIAMARKHPDVLSDPISYCANLKQETKGTDTRSCYHVMGHGIADYYGTGVAPMVAVCDRIKEPLFHKDCLEGIMMELLGILTVRSVPVHTQSTLVKFCEQFQSENKAICYGDSGVYAHYLLPDKAEAVSTCQHVPKQYQTSCAQNVGHFLFYLYLSDIPKFTDMCKVLDFPMYETCITTGIEIAKTQKNKKQLLDAICTTVKPGFFGQCFSATETK